MPAAPVKLLVVDDEEDVRDTAAEFLADLGYEVVCAADGDEALKIVGADTSLALLLTDIDMPGELHGFALARLAKAIRPDLRVVYVTGHHHHPGIDAAGALHGPIVRKPFRLLKLAEEIKRVLERAEAGTATARAAERQAHDDLDEARLELAQHRQDALAFQAAIDQAVSLNRAKTRLLAAVGHDLRQPLTVIIGTLETLAAKLDERHRPMVARAEAAAARLDRGIDGILKAARLEFGGIEPKPRPFAIAPLLAELRDQHAADAQRKKLGFRVVDSGAHIVSDPALLASVLHNLVGNAIKYTREGRVLVGCRRRGGKLLISIRDTGVGIAPDMLEAIFDEYRQLVPARGTGVGLGLAIAKRATELLHHALSVSSIPGRGSCFCVEVPAAAPAQMAAPPRICPPGRLRVTTNRGPCVVTS
jgi:signal transduction histidine kinase